MKIAIKNARVVDPRSRLDALRNLFLADGRIAAVTEVSVVPEGFADARQINASNLLVCPGLIDLCARLPDLENELAAAAAGGITTLACPPDTTPPLDEARLVERLRHRSEQSGLARMFPLGALTQGLVGEKLTEMVKLANAGCIAFSQASAPLPDTLVLWRALQYAATFGFSVWLRPKDARLAFEGAAHDGAVAARLGLPGIPVSAETVAIATVLQLARDTGARLHLTRISSAEGIALIRRAREEGQAITCDVGIHHLHLDESEIGYFDTNARFDPPLRSAADRAALSAAAAEGVLAICSDHTPVSDDGKHLPFAEALPGAVGLELLLPLVLRWAKQENIPLTTALARVTCDAAAILGLDAGHLSPGAAADLCIFDPQASWQAGAQTLRTQGKNTPFSGQTLRGRVQMTFINGQLVFSR
ncbi:MAG: dihydroorotase [Betaproteobacteria bacterium]|nr:dihydroorotase [Betaproteobacteria bacterium]